MARARRKHHPEPSLFPFLSILACVIGALALLITTQAVGQIATDAVDVDHYEKLEERIASDRLSLAGLQALFQEVESLDRELAAAAKERSSLAAELGPDAAAGAPLRERLGRVGEHNSQLERELALLAKGARERSSELAAQRASEQAPLRVRPSGSGLGLSPQFAEARREGLRLHTGAGPVDVPTHLIPTNAEYRYFVRGAAQRDKTTVIFLIRPGGVPAYEIALKSIHEARLRTAEIPIPGDGPLDLSAFYPAEEQAP